MITESTSSSPPSTINCTTPSVTPAPANSTLDEHREEITEDNTKIDKALFDQDPNNSHDNPPDVLRAELKRVFPNNEARARQHERAVMELVKGVHLLDALKHAGITWPHVGGIKLQHPRYREMWNAAENCGKAIRQAQRERALHKRGTAGWQEPVFQKGELVGHIRKFSDNCLLAALRAEDPAKYREDAKPSGSSGVIVQVNLGINLGIQPPPKVYDLTLPVSQDALESVIEAKPELQEPQKTEENKE